MISGKEEASDYEMLTSNRSCSKRFIGIGQNFACEFNFMSMKL